MPELLSFANVQNFVLTKMNEEIDDTSDWLADVRTIVTAKHRELVAHYPWMSLEKYPPAVVLAPAVITTLTLTITGGQTSLTLGGPAAGYAGDLDNYKLIPSGADYIIRITAHTAGSTSATVDAAPVTLAAVACTAFLDEVDLPSDFHLFINGGWTNGGHFIAIKPHEVLQKDYPEKVGASWPPKFAARIGATKLRFSHYPDARKRVEIPYTYDPGDPSGTGTMTIDGYLRTVLAQMALPDALRLKHAEAEARIAETRAEMALARAVEHERKLRLAMFGTLSHEQPATPMWA